MDPNVLLYEPPRTVSICGGSVRIRAEYRVWIGVQELIEDPAIPRDALGGLILRAVFSRREGEDAICPYDAARSHPEDALAAALAFYNFNEPQRPLTARQRKTARIRSFDWSWDAHLVIADFQREYGIDLTDSSLRMHWWRFWSLFRGLGDGSRTMTAIAIRTADEGKLPKEARAELREKKQALLLPARTREEVERNRSLRWGQDV